MASSVDMELGDMMYELCLMALFFVEGQICLCRSVKISISNELWPDSLLSLKGSSAQGDGG